MKHFLYLFFAISLITCKSTDLQKKTPFKINGASYNYWVGGQPGVSGIRVIINYKTIEDVSFDQIYFQKKEGIIETYKKEGNTYLIGRINTGKRKGKSLVLDIDPNKEANNKPPVAMIPYELKDNEAMLVYTYQGKKLTYKVKNIQKTETDFYP